MDDRYRRGAHTVLELKYHFVWKTKYSFPVLRGEIGLFLREVIRQVCADKGMAVISGNVRANHVHMLIEAPAHMSPAKVAQMLKGRSSYKIQAQFPQLKKRYWGRHLWARGYFCATVGSVDEATIKKYIEDQDDAPPEIKIWDEGRL